MYQKPIIIDVPFDNFKNKFTMNVQVFHVFDEARRVHKCMFAIHEPVVFGRAFSWFHWKQKQNQPKKSSWNYVPYILLRLPMLRFAFAIEQSLECRFRFGSAWSPRDTVHRRNSHRGVVKVQCLRVIYRLCVFKWLSLNLLCVFFSFSLFRFNRSSVQMDCRGV